MPIARFISVFIMALAMLFVLPIQNAWAQGVAVNVIDCTPNASPPTNPVDTALRNNEAAVGQQASQDLANFWATLPKIDAAKSQCTDQLMSNYNNFVNGISGLTDPLGVITGLLQNQLLGLLNSACSSVMSAVSQTAQSLSSLARICVPLPNFGLGSFSGLNLQGCSGGTVIPLTAGTGVWSSPYPNNTFLLK